jgi:predicted dehydrogenase
MKTFAIAGTGTRGLCFARALLRDYGHAARLVALFDHNRTRMSAFCDALGAAIPCYSDFAAMALEQRPDALIITTPDHTHDQFIELAYLHDMDAICEKPLATSVEKVTRILELDRQFGRRLRVTFNFRYSTFAQNVKRALIDNPIGDIRSVNLEWFLDRTHGAEYFRRWHRHRDLSGGLLVHKSTHHFDYVNWLLQDHVRRVAGFGSLQFYGSAGPFRGPQCRRCDHAHECPFFFNTNDNEDSVARLRRMFLHAEHEDGYLRDRCVFGHDIDIHDTMSVLAEYHGGAQLNYSLTAYNAAEGYRLSINGTDGRIEAEEFFGGLMLRGDVKRSPIRIIRGRTRRDVTLRELQIDVDRSDHGGGDARLYRDLFEPGHPDPLGQNATALDGANSCLVGICANQAIEQRRTIELPDLSAYRAAAHAATPSVARS